MYACMYAYCNLVALLYQTLIIVQYLRPRQIITKQSSLGFYIQLVSRISQVKYMNAYI